MIGYFLSKNIGNVLAYLFPAYMTFKAYKYKTDQSHWLRYWAIMGLFSFFEFYADFFISWIPFYYETKLALLAWLVVPRTRGTAIVWSQYVKPLLNSREQAIDAAALQLKARISGQIEMGKRQFLRFLATKALGVVESSKNPLLAAVVTPLLLPATLEVAQVAQIESKIEELPDQDVPVLAASQCDEGKIDETFEDEEDRNEMEIASFAPKNRDRDLISSPVRSSSSPSSKNNLSPLRDVTNNKKTPNSSPTSQVRLVKPRKAAPHQINQNGASRIVKKGRATQEVENMQAQSFPAKRVAGVAATSAVTKVNQRRTAAAAISREIASQEN